MQYYKDILRQKVLEGVDLCRDIEDREILEMIDREILSYSRETYISITDKLSLRREIFNSIRRLDILQELKTVLSPKLW